MKRTVCNQEPTMKGISEFLLTITGASALAAITPTGLPRSKHIENNWTVFG